jgi:hypothetical protein
MNPMDRPGPWYCLLSAINVVKQASTIKPFAERFWLAISEGAAHMALLDYMAVLAVVTLALFRARC